MSPDAMPVEVILCPTDFSLFSSRALRHAIALAVRFGARLEVAHVAPPVGAAGVGSPLSLPVATATQAVRRHTQAELRRFVQPAAEARVHVETQIREGEPWREILALADELPADLVVLGTHGRSGFERFVLGSVTEKLLSRLPCPVLTVCHEEGRTWEAPGCVGRVLCATDLSESASETAAFALMLAAQDRAELTLLHVAEHPSVSSESPSLAGLGSIREQLERVAADRLGELARGLEARFGLAVTPRLARGSAHREILGVAAEERADLIVLGQGHGALHRFLLGSNARHVVREATCPVLTVRPLPLRSRPRRAAPEAVAAMQPAGQSTSQLKR